MDIATLRKELGLSLEDFAARLGLKSRGQASDLETGARRPSVRVALALEVLSEGRLKARDLNPTCALVEAHQQQSADQDAA